MRILLISNIYPSAARPFAGVFITKRIAALEACGHEVWAYGIRPVGVGLVAVESRVRGRATGEPVPIAPFEEYLLPVNLSRRLRRTLDTARVAATKALVALVEQEGIDLVHGHGMYLFPAGAVARDVAAAAGVPYVVTVHGSDVNVIMPRRKAAFADVLDRAAVVLADSHDLAASVRQVMTVPDKVQVIHNGYDPEVFTLDPEVARPGARLLFVGNLEPIKGADRLPELMRHVRTERPDAQLDVVGGGPLSTQLRAELPDATFHGQVPPAEVAGHMRRSDVLVVPSRNEGWGCVITEALACGTPTVAFDVGGIHEGIGVQEHLVPPEAGVPALARKVVSTLAEGTEPQALAQLAAGRTWADVARAESAAYRLALTDAQ